MMWSKTLIYSLVFISTAFPGNLCNSSCISFKSDGGGGSQQHKAIQRGSHVDIEFTVPKPCTFSLIEIYTDVNRTIICQMINGTCSSSENRQECECHNHRDYIFRIYRKDECWKVNQSIVIEVKLNDKIMGSERVVVYPAEGNTGPCKTNSNNTNVDGKDDGDGNNDENNNSTEHARRDQNDDDDDVNGLKTPVLAAVVVCVIAAVAIVGALVIGLWKGRHGRTDREPSQTGEAGRGGGGGAALTDEDGYAVVREEYSPPGLAPGMPRAAAAAAATGGKRSRPSAKEEAGCSYAEVYDARPSLAPGMPRNAKGPGGRRQRQPAGIQEAEEQTLNDEGMYVPMEVIQERKRKNKH